MKKKYILIFSAAMCLAAGCATKGGDSGLKMLVGTYTDGNDSPGVYLMDFDQENASWSLLDTARSGNPSFLIPSADRTRAYSVGEFEDGNQGAYSYLLTDDSIDVLNFQYSDGAASGAAPCNIIVVEGNVVTSNYTGGTASSFPVLEDGGLAPMSRQFIPEEDIVHHMHCAVLSPDGKYLFMTDLGADALFRFTVGDSGNPFSDCRVACQFDRGVHPGPRHMVFSADGRFAYLIHELGDLLTVFAYDDGELRHISTEKAYAGEGHGSADIHLTPDGRFLYTSHRLKEDGISIFKVNREDGTVENAGYCRTGKHPRNFTITPNGKYLLCACRDSDRIEIYSIDPEDGSPAGTGKTIDVPAPVCVQLY